MRKAIAIDFDGCLCTDAFPAIGDPNWPVINQAKAEQQAGAGLILWTCREDQLLLDAIAACEGWGLTFDSVNESLPDWIEAFKTQPRKVGASEYWDDKSVNPTALNGTYVSMEWFSQINAELRSYKDAGLTPEGIRALISPPNDPLTLEELRDMGGEPVFIMRMESDEPTDRDWALVDLKYDMCRTVTGGMAIFELYGSTWLAYRRKPEEASEK